MSTAIRRTLAQVCEGRGITQAELARKTDMHIVSIGRYWHRTAEPSASRAQVIARVLSEKGHPVSSDDIAW